MIPNHNKTASQETLFRLQIPSIHSIAKITVQTKIPSPPSKVPQSCELFHTSGEECEIDCFHCVT